MMGLIAHLPSGLHLELSRRSRWRAGSTVAAVNGCELPMVYSFTLRTDQSTRGQPCRFWQMNDCVSHRMKIQTFSLAILPNCPNSALPIPAFLNASFT